MAPLPPVDDDTEAILPAADAHQLVGDEMHPKLVQRMPACCRNNRTARVWGFHSSIIVLSVLCLWLSAVMSFNVGDDDVPFTMQVFVVLALTPSIGSMRAVAAVAMYVLLGTAGLPFFAGEDHGPHVIAGPTGGYLVGFVLAQFVVGFACIKYGAHLSLRKCCMAMLAGDLTIYLIGVPWLAIAADLSFRSVTKRCGDLHWVAQLLCRLTTCTICCACYTAYSHPRTPARTHNHSCSAALHGGFLLFIGGDLVKVGLASITIPMAWKALHRWGNVLGLRTNDAAATLMPEV